MCASGDIFQAKLDKPFGDTEGAKIYFDVIIILSKDFFTKHIEKLSIIFDILHASDLKLNAPKYSFGLNEIPFLGYVISREGIKPNPKKIKGIIDLG